MVSGNVTVLQLIATDPDVGPGGKIMYEITGGNGNGDFKIGLHTGIVQDLNLLFLNFVFGTSYNRDHKETREHLLKIMDSLNSSLQKSYDCNTNGI